MLTEAFTIHRDRLRARFFDFGERLRDRLLLGATISGPDYVAATRWRRKLCSALALTLRDVDVLLTATTGGEAPEIANVPKWQFDKPSLMMPFNLSGVPAISVCIGFGPSGLPLGVQLTAAKPFAEPTVFRVAHTYETLTNWRSRRPELMPSHN